MTQMETFDLFIALASRIFLTYGYEQLQEIHEFFEVGVMPDRITLPQPLWRFAAVVKTI